MAIEYCGWDIWKGADGSRLWSTSCNNLVDFGVGSSPIRMSFKFCPFCGKEILDMYEEYISSELDKVFE